MNARWPLRKPAAGMYGAIFVLLLIGVATDLMAQTQIRLPNTGKKPENGLQVMVEVDPMGGPGYRPIRVRLVPWPAGSNKADRRVTVKIEPSQWNWGTGSVSSTEEILIPEGANAVEHEMTIVQHSGWSGFRIEVREDGKKLDDISSDAYYHMSIPYYEWSEATPSLLFISQAAGFKTTRAAMLSDYINVGRVVDQMQNPTYDLPDSRVLARLVPTQHSGVVQYGPNKKRMVDGAIVEMFTQSPRLELRSPAELGDRWTHLTTFDISLISMDDLAAMPSNEPKAWKALQTWVFAGGTLIVYGVGKDWARLQELEKLLEMESLAADEWRQPVAKEYGKLFLDMKRLNIPNRQPMQYQVGPDGRPIAQPNQPTTKDPPPTEAPFVFREAKMGMVCAIAAEDAFPGETRDWAWVMNSIPSGRWKWFQRHGLSLHRQNKEYWNWLIPGVGKPPVRSFFVMITGFVVVIGPLNYLLLFRSRRLYMLLVTVPLGAALFTIGLFGYALYSDGLSTRVRMRSFTELDQGSGKYVTWSRQSYYAAISPSQGLEFPRSAVIYPIDINPRGENTRRRTGRLVVWDGDQQRLAKGFLQPRTIAQFLVVNVTETKQQIEFSGTDDLRAKNQLGAKVELLVARGEDGKYDWCGPLDSGKSQPLKPISAANAQEKLSKFYLDNLPQYPEGFDPNRYESYGFRNRNWMYYGNDVDQSEVNPMQRHSLMEINIQHALRALELSPKSYIAVLKTNPLVPVGVEKPVEKDSLHVIRGTWK